MKLNKKLGGLFILLLWALSFGEKDYRILTFPFSPKKNSDLVEISWGQANNPGQTPDSADIYFSRSPGGSNPANYQYKVTTYDATTYNKPKSGSGFSQRQIFFTPKDQPNNIMTAGFFYYIVASINDGDTLVSDELTMIVKTQSAPDPTYPKSGTVDDLNPIFSWSTVSGVPYYHVILSDENISYDDSGLEGLSIIWQAITPNASIRYGEPDPSGTITAVPPPLSPGTEYNWMVLNNYGNQAAYSDNEHVSIPGVFQIAGDSIEKPENVYPADEDDFSESQDEIEFKWTKSEDAVIYNIYVYVSAELDSNYDAKMIVWENTTTDTTITMQTASVLTKNLYEWRVYAINDRGAGRASDITGFHYNAPTGKISVVTKEEVTDELTLTVSAVEIQVDVLDGSLEKPLIFFTDNNGNLNRNRPAGTYRLTAVKEGYLEDSRTVTIDDGETESIEFILKKPDATVYGRVSENVSGSDNKGIQLATVYAVSDRGDTVTAQTDNNGYFVLNSYSESWSFWAVKTGYVKSIPSSKNISAGQSVKLDEIVLTKNPNILSGTVKNTSNTEILGVNIKVFRNGVLMNELASTAEDGYFAFSLASGTYMIKADKAGFTTQTRTVELLGSKRVDITMEPGAGVIKGYVIAKSWVNGQYVYAPLPNASIMAVNIASNDTITAVTDKTYGDYTISLAGEEIYELISSKEGYTRVSGTNEVNLTSATTVTRMDTLLSLGTVTGTVSDSAGAIINDAVVALIDTTTSQVVVSGKSYSDGSFEVRNVPDGTYLLSAGKTEENQVFTLTSPLNRMIRILDGKSDTATIVLTAGDKIILWKAQDREGIKITNATVKIQSPVRKNITILDTIFNVGPGDYVIKIDAEDSTILDLKYHKLAVTANDSFVTETIQMPVTHIKKDTTSLNSSAETITLSLASASDLDSIKLSYKDVNGETWKDTMISVSAGSYSISFKPPMDGSYLFYYYTAWQGGNIFSNQTVPYSTYIPASTNLKYVEIVPDTSGGPLQFPKKLEATFSIHGYDGAFNLLDSSIDSVSWDLSNELSGMKITEDPEDPLKATINIGSDTTTSAITVTATITYGQQAAKTVSTAFEVTNNELNKINIRRTDDLINRHISSTQSASFEVVAYDTNNNTTVNITPKWRIRPAGAGTITDQGKFTPRPKFVGQVTVEASNNAISAKYNAGATLPAEEQGLQVRYDLVHSSNPDTINDAESFSLIFPSGFVAEGAPAQIVVKKPQMENKIIQSQDSMNIVGSIYDITELNNVSFNTGSGKKMSLRLTVPQGDREAETGIALWDEDDQVWDLQTAVDEGDTVKSLDIEHFSRYALLSKAQELGIGEFSLMPNPFSPYITAEHDGNDQPGLRIRFKPNSLTDDPQVTVRIYTLAGNLVRKLPIGSREGSNEDVILSRTTQTYYWDGRTDNGRMARNGRYIVRITVKDSKVYDEIKTVVLMK